jgi:ankyrin repeat protein
MGIFDYFAKKKNETSKTKRPQDGQSETWSPYRLGMAVYRGTLADVKAALNDGADPNTVLRSGIESERPDWPSSHKGESVLMIAAYNSNNSPEQTEIVRLLLEAGAKPNFRDVSGRDALINAALNIKFSDQTPIIKTLLQYGADPNHVENNGTQTAIGLAAYYGSSDIVKALLDSNLITNEFSLSRALENKYGSDGAVKSETKREEIRDLIETYIDKLQAKKGTDPAKTTVPKPKIIHFEGGAEDLVTVTIRVEGNIMGTNMYGGEYDARLPLDMASPQLLNHIAEKISVIGGFHMGYMLMRGATTILTCREQKTLRAKGVTNGDVLTFVDWG